MAKASGLKGIAWRRGLVIGVLALAAWDFLDFRARVTGMAPLAPATRADAIVVLTGGSGLRIAEGMRLLGEERGEKLLISGVNPNVSGDEVARRAGGDPSLYKCCVDVGYEAETTRGNARETAHWAAEGGFGSLLVVTSDYHMPRSLIHLSKAMPDVILHPAPVRTKIDARRVLKDRKSLYGLMLEWAKWRVTWAGRAFR